MKLWWSLGLSIADAGVRFADDAGHGLICKRSEIDLVFAKVKQIITRAQNSLR